MNVLILGGGGREHTFAWKIKQSPQCQDLHVIPGNAGTASIATNHDLDILNFEAVLRYVREHRIDLVIVGPEKPLVEGIVDYLEENMPSLKVFGPKSQGAMLEGSKAFSKEFMKEYNIPTAGYLEVTETNLDEGLSHIDTSVGPYVLKADGLAAGKGVLIISDRVEAKEELKNMLGGKFGSASETVVIEEFLSGLEFSVFVMTNGQSYVLLPEAKDYKRIGEGDTGLNTGGMGAVSPVPFVDTVMMDKVKERIILPTLNGLQDRSIDYRGFIFFGLIEVNGEPFVIEYNCRMGDPETEVVLPRIQNDFLEVCTAFFDKDFQEIVLDKDPRSAATVMTVSGGYPESYEKGKLIKIDEKHLGDSIIFHAGTKSKDDQVITNGGRVIAVTSLAQNHQEAIASSMNSIESISFDGKYYRKDIGFDL